MPEEKTNAKTKTPAVQAPQSAPPAGPKKNNVAIWILVGCLGIFLVAGLVVAGIFFWGAWKVKKGFDKNVKPEIEKWQQTSEDIRNQADKFNQQMEGVSEQMQGVLGAVPQSTSEEPAAGEAAMGYVKKVYSSGGKNFLDIDYIQWLVGDAAEQAMREDGECPKKGECIVLNDYYIRNQNPKLRTFEIAPSARITMMTYQMETTGQIFNEAVTFSQFSQIWSGSGQTRLRDTPYYITLSNNLVSSIKEQYIP